MYKQTTFVPCRGSTKETRGTAYVVYEDIYDAKTAVEHLSGFNVANRYLIVLYYNHQKHSKKVCRSGCVASQEAALQDAGNMSRYLYWMHSLCWLLALFIIASQLAMTRCSMSLFTEKSSLPCVCAVEHQGEGRRAVEDAGKVWC